MLASTKYIKYFRYTWAMDNGRLSLTLCEAVVEEHSQPEEVLNCNQPYTKVKIGHLKLYNSFLLL